jgi:hypothetical protein
MRIASGIFGVGLALAGTGLIALPVYVLALRHWSPGVVSGIVSAFIVGAGIGCLLAGRYLLRLKLR